MAKKLKAVVTDLQARMVQERDKVIKLQQDEITSLKKERDDGMRVVAILLERLKYATNYEDAGVITVAEQQRFAKGFEVQSEVLIDGSFRLTVLMHEHQS